MLSTGALGREPSALSAAPFSAWNRPSHISKRDRPSIDPWRSFRRYGTRWRTCRRSWKRPGNSLITRHGSTVRARLLPISRPWQIAHKRARQENRRHMSPVLRWLWLYGRIPHLQDVPRCKGGNDSRRHLRDHEGDHRPYHDRSGGLPACLRKTGKEQETNTKKLRPHR